MSLRGSVKARPASARRAFGGMSRAHDNFERAQDADYDRLRTGLRYHEAQRVHDTALVARRWRPGLGSTVDHATRPDLRGGVVLSLSEAPAGSSAGWGPPGSAVEALVLWPGCPGPGACDTGDLRTAVTDEEPEPSDTAPVSDDEPAARPCCPECYGGPTVGCAEGGNCLCHRGGR